MIFIRKSHSALAGVAALPRSPRVVHAHGPLLQESYLASSSFISYLPLLSLHTLLVFNSFLIVSSHLSWIASILGQRTHLYIAKRQCFYDTT